MSAAVWSAGLEKKEKTLLSAPTELGSAWFKGAMEEQAGYVKSTELIKH